MLEKKCFHCGLSISCSNKYFLEIDGIIRQMCCPGCLVISRFIIDGGFYDYYLYRDKPSNNTGELVLNNVSEYDIYNDLEIQKKFIIFDKNGFANITLAIEGINCAACTWLIERYLNRINYINRVFVNLSTSRAHITWDINKITLSSLLFEINKIGYKAYPYLFKKQEDSYKKEYKNELKKIIVAGIGMMQVMMLAFGMYIGEGNDMQTTYWSFIRYVSFFVATPVLFFSSKDIFYNAYRNIKQHSLGMDVTISLSLLLAYFSSIYNLFFKIGDVYFDSICMFIFLLLIGRFFEMRTRHRSSDIIYSLQKLDIDIAVVLVNNSYVEVSVDKLKIGDKLFIKPGSVIAVDSVVLDGNSSVNESMLTGEPFPVLKTTGSFVIGGSTNIENFLIVEVVKTKIDSTINIILNLLEHALISKPKIALLADKIASYFVLFVLIITFFVSLIWFYIGNDNVLSIVLSMLVVSCPCALSLATPLAITSATNLLAKLGFLIKEAHVLETLSKVTDVVFDKTGTLTTNDFILSRVDLVSTINIKEVYSIAFSLENMSQHPIASAFLNFDKKFSCNIYNCENIKNYINNGIEGRVNGIDYRIGKYSFISEWNNSVILSNYSSEKEMCIFLASRYEVLALFYLVNPIRKNSFDLVLSLKEKGINLHILSGDSSCNVDYVAKKLSIENYKKDFSVKNKSDYIKYLQEHGAIVMTVGDGVNDALALGVSQISVAMGSGVDLAKVNSDAVLLNNNLFLLSDIINKSRKTQMIILQNVLWALFYNFFGILAAAFGIVTPYFAALGMSCSSLIVVLNSLRLGKL